MRMTAFKDRLLFLKKVVIATLVGVAVFLLVLAVYWSCILRLVEIKALDHRFNRYAKPTQASSDIVLVTIDDPSIQTYGRWPWHRDLYGYMARYLRAGGARAIVLDILLLEPDEDEAFDIEFASAIQDVGNVFLAFLMNPTTATLSQASE